MTITSRTDPATGVVSTAREEGNLRQWGRPGVVEESRPSNVISQDGGPSGRRRGSDVPMKPGNAGGGKGPLTTSEDGWAALSRDKVTGAAAPLVTGVLVKERRGGD
jgi:hypothetical protein